MECLEVLKKALDKALGMPALWTGLHDGQLNVVLTLGRIVYSCLCFCGSSSCLPGALFWNLLSKAKPSNTELLRVEDSFLPAAHVGVYSVSLNA